MEPGNCKSCGAEIYWAITELGKKMPVDAKPVNYVDRGVMLLRVIDGELRVEFVLRGTEGPDWKLNERDDELIGRNKYVSHFATCPHAKAHRGK